MRRCPLESRAANEGAQGEPNIEFSMLQNFPAFRPEDFSRALEEVKGLPDNYRPKPEELQKSVRGYAEVNRMYHAACFDGRRGPYVRMHFNPSVGVDANILTDLSEKFFAQVGDMAAHYKIPKEGYSICIQDKSCLIIKDEYEYFMLAEILDGHLRPTIIGPGCVDSFMTAPVAFVVGFNGKVDVGFMFPIFTVLAFREVVKKVSETPLHELQRIPTPSHGFSLICGAICRSLNDDESGPSWLKNSLAGEDGQCERLKPIFMPSNFNCVSDAVRELTFEGSLHCPIFKVTCDFDGSIQEYKVKLARNTRFGQVTAGAVNVTEKLEDGWNSSPDY